MIKRDKRLIKWDTTSHHVAFTQRINGLDGHVGKP
jgi:hypothetical protein